MRNDGFLLKNLCETKPEVLQQVIAKYIQQRDERKLSPFPGPFTDEEYSREHKIIWALLLEKIDSTDYTENGLSFDNFSSILDKIRKKMGTTKDYEHALRLNEANRNIRS